MQFLKTVAALSVTTGLCACASADSQHRADAHAPIGVMGDHTHEKGEFMFSYRYMRMDMAGNGDGTDSLSPAQIATTVPNVFFGNPMQPPTLRVVPLEMTMDMHMLGFMYAPSERYTLMAMVNYVSLDMDHVTFQGGMGTTELGNFTTTADAFGDTTVAALIKLGTRNAWHATVGLSLPTGDIENNDDVLTPLNTTPNLRLPYPMQIGSGSYDLVGGLTWRGSTENLGWGAQWRSVIRLADNDEDYRYGDDHQLTGWTSFAFKHNVSVSGRLTLQNRGKVDGIDPQIVAPVQTANPDFQGFTRLDLGLGANYLLHSGHRIAGEFTLPVYQDLNGPQLETDWHFTLGYQKSF